METITWQQHCHQPKSLEQHQEVQMLITVTAVIIPNPWHMGKHWRTILPPPGQRSLRSETRQSSTKQARSEQRAGPDLPRVDTYAQGGLCP